MMPISKFAVLIAETLADYLSNDNPVQLPSAYQYDQDNSSLLNPYTVSNLSHVATGIAANTARRAINATFYTLGMWSAPAPAPATSSSALGCSSTPITKSCLAVPGIEGVDRAIQIARHFGLLEDPKNREQCIEILKNQAEGRGEDILKKGFNTKDRNNIMQNEIIAIDCDRICSFLTHKDRWHEKTSGRKIIETIRKFFHIHHTDIQTEKELLEEFCVVPLSNDEDNEDDEVVVVPQLRYVRTSSIAPIELRVPENALYKLIYDRAVTRKESVQNEIEFTTIYPSPSRFQNVSTHSYSRYSGSSHSQQSTQSTHNANNNSQSPVRNDSFRSRKFSFS